MTYSVEIMSAAHRAPVMGIFNYYVENGFAAYFETPLPEAAFVKIQEMTRGYPAYVVKSATGEVVGFGFLHAWHPAPAFRRTAEISYFIRHDCTRAGAGRVLLDRLIAEGRSMGVDNILASISSRNGQSLAFHLKHGFVECGRFPSVGRKRGQEFDVVWMQKRLLA